MIKRSNIKVDFKPYIINAFRKCKKQKEKLQSASQQITLYRQQLHEQLLSSTQSEDPDPSSSSTWTSQHYHNIDTTLNIGTPTEPKRFKDKSVQTTELDITQL